MNHSYARDKLTLLLRDLSNYTADEFRRQMVRIVNGATGSNIPDDCHLPDTANPVLAQRIAELERKLTAAEPAAARLAEIQQVWEECAGFPDSSAEIEALRIAIEGEGV